MPKVDGLSVMAILLTSFISGLYIPTAAGNFYISYAFLFLGLFTLLAKKWRRISKSKLIVFLVFLLIYSYICIFLFEYNWINNKIFISLIDSAGKIGFLGIYLLAFFAVYQVCGRSISVVFYKYLKISYVFAIFGIFQEIIFILLKINISSFIGANSKDYGAFIGVAGLSVEPAFYACALLPAACYHLVRFISKWEVSWHFVIFVLAILLSTSSLGYMGLVICGAITYLKKITVKNIFFTVISFGVFLVIASTALNTDFFKLRLDDTLNLIENQELTLDSGVNLSTYAIGVNAAVAYKSLLDNNGLGAGFGQYYTVYDKYIYGFDQPTFRESIPGRGSAASLLIRFTGELGVVGWLLIYLFVIRKINIRSPLALTDVNIAFTSTLIIILLRMGEYYVNGVIFSFCFLYYSNMEIKKKIINPTFDAIDTAVLHGVLHKFPLPR